MNGVRASARVGLRVHYDYVVATVARSVLVAVHMTEANNMKQTYCLVQHNDDQQEKLKFFGSSEYIT